MSIPQTAPRRIHVVQGEATVETGEHVVLTTLLGSCVAACIRDAGAGIGGMNHFLLPGGESSLVQGRVESYGIFLMEVLVNGLLKKGARRHCLEAKLFGGARTMDGLSDVGARNGDFAKTFLEAEGIRHVGGSLGGDRGRRVEFWPRSGRARQILMNRAHALPAPPPAWLPSGGDLELF